MDESAYDAQLDAVASLVSEWGAAAAVRAGIQAAPARGPGYTGGGGARAISIPLDVAAGGDGRAGEWG